MTLQQIEERIELLFNRSKRIADKYPLSNDKARTIILKMSMEYAILQSQYNMLTTPQPKYPEGTL